jgi:hypothetical protein
VHHVKPRAGGGEAAKKGADHRVERRVGVVVADPVFEEVAEDVERIRPRRVLLDEAKEPLVRLRAIFTQVKIGDEEVSGIRGQGINSSGAQLSELMP